MRPRGRGLTSAGTPAVVGVLLSAARSANNDVAARLDALDELSEVFFTNVDADKAVESDQINKPTECASKFLKENLEVVLFPALNAMLKDENEMISNRSAQLLSRIGAALDGDAWPFFSWLLRVLDNFEKKSAYSQSLDQSTACRHLSIISGTLRLSGSSALEPFAARITARLQCVLENLQSHQLVAPIVEVLQTIGTRFPEVFSPVFKDVVDLMLGWSLDPNIPAPSRVQISSSFSEFRQLWIENIVFTESLLNKFVMDIEGLCYQGLELTSGFRSMDFFYEMEYLAMCFIGVIEGTGDEYIAKKHAALYSRILHSFEKVSKISVAFRLEVCRSLSSLSYMLFGMKSPRALLVTVPLLAGIKKEDDETATLIKMIRTVEDAFFASGDASIDGLAVAEALVGPASSIPALRVHMSPAVGLAVRSLYRKILQYAGRQGSGSAVVDMYLGEVQFLFSQIAANNGAAQGASRRSVEQLILETEVTMVLMIRLIRDQVCDSPTLWRPEFLPKFVAGMSLCFSNQTSERLALNHLKGVALSLCIMTLEWSAVSESVLLQLVGAMSGVISPDASQGVKKFACDTLKAVANHLAKPEFSRQMSSDMRDALATAASSQIQALSSDPDIQVRLHAAACLEDVASIFAANHSCALKLVQCCMMRLQDSSQIVTRSYLSVLGHIAHLLLVHPPRLLCRLSSEGLAVQEYQREFLGLNNCSLRTLDFQRFVGFVSQRANLDITLYLPRAWNVSQSLSSRSSRCRTAPQEFESWAVVEAARFCVKSRLRTAFGGPMQTFEALEHMLLETCARGELELRKAGGSNHNTNRQNAVRMLLNFLVHLERQVYNAFEGSVNLPACSAVSIKFFRGNKKVCEDWFSRLRKSLVQTSLVAKAPFHVLEFAGRRISELCRILSKAPSREDVKKFKGELDTLVLSYLGALQEVRDSDAVDGFAAWAKTALKPISGLKDCAGWIQALSLQCRGRLQEAEELYQKSFLSSSLLPEVYFFIVRNAARCCVETADWKKWQQWEKRFQDFTLQDRLGGEENQYFALKRQLDDLFTDNLINAMINFDAGEIQQAEEKISRVPDIDPKEIRDLQESLDLSDAYLLKALINVKKHRIHDALAAIEKSVDMIQEPLHIAHSEMGCQLQAAKIPAVMLGCCNFVKEALLGKKSGTPSAFYDSVTQIELEWHKCDSSLHDIGLLQKLLRGVKTACHAEDSSSLMLQMAKIARRQGNLDFAEGLIAKDGAALTTRYEKAQLLLAKGQHVLGFQKMWDLLLHVRDFSIAVVMYGKDEFKISEKILLKVAKLLQDKSFCQVQEQDCDIFTNVMAFCQANGIDAWLSQLGEMTESAHVPEIVGGFFLQECTALHPDYIKGWAEYASWCYRQGRRQMDWTGKSTSGPMPPGLVDQRARIKAALIDSGESNVLGGMDIGVDDMTEKIGEIFVANNGDDGGLDPTTAGYLSNVRRACESALPLASPMSIDSLVRIWRSARVHVLNLYASAAKGYFEYLRLSQAASDSHETRAYRAESVDITATLRLLRLLVKYGDDLQALFSENLQTTPTRPWRSIVPQLFARLGHAQPGVRQQVQALITRIGDSSPHDVVYPTIVGFEENSSSRELSGLLDNLKAKCPDLVNAVQRMVRELARCAVLKEDDLLCELQEVSQMVSSGLRLMREEVARVRVNATLTEQDRVRILKEKYDAIMKPADLALDRLRRVFAGPADCDHDRAFHAHHHAAFLEACKAFRAPDSVYTPDSAWEPMKAVMKALSKQVRRGSLTLSHVSPYLASLRSTDIPLPGVSLEGGADDSHVTIASFESRVELLMTKTKPKKITMAGSDGRSYTYLLKGREDLHLDERMMQFLEIVNKFLRQDKASDCRGLRARHYAVIPLGPRSGLIQWADGTVPLYGVYKAWQARQLSGDGSGKEASPPRPSDLFYEKIMPALKECGISRITSRRDWPMEVLRSVYAQLVHETPRELLARELQCASLSPAELWAKTNGHAQSVAVMSMVGYVIGLGDRHLDNILIDFRSGEVVHIDWNVCFEKGARLKVPELVPFRMTHTMQAAMGFAGLEGPFRIACERSLRVLRRNKEALLTLLEAFVYDPVVDWTAEKQAQQASKSVELHVSLSLFASRVDEMRVSLADNERQGAAALGSFQRLLAQIVDLYASDLAARMEAEKLAATAQGLDQQIAAMGWEEGELARVLAECGGRQPHAEAIWAHAKAAVEERLAMCAQGFAQQSAAVHFVRSAPVPAYMDQVRGWLAEPLAVAPVAKLAADLRKRRSAAGELPLDGVCVQMERGVCAAYGEALEGASRCLSALLEYRAAVQTLPADYCALSRTDEWRAAFERVLADPSPHSIEACMEGFGEAAAAARREEGRQRCLEAEREVAAARAAAAALATRLAAQDPAEGERALSAAHHALAADEDYCRRREAACCLQLYDAYARLGEFPRMAAPRTRGGADALGCGTPHEDEAAAGGGEAGGPAEALPHTVWIEGVAYRAQVVLREAGGGAGAAEAGVERVAHALERVEGFVADLARVILPEVARALHADPGVRELVGRLFELTLQTSRLAEGGGWQLEAGGGGGAGRRERQLAALADVRAQHEALCRPRPPGADGEAGDGGGGGGGGGEAAPGGRVLLAAFERAFASLEADCARLCAAGGAEGAAAAASDFFVEKMAAMEGALRAVVQGLAAGAPPHALVRQALAPVRRFAAGVCRRVVAPHLWSIVRGALARLLGAGGGAGDADLARAVAVLAGDAAAARAERRLFDYCARAAAERDAARERRALQAQAQAAEAQLVLLQTQLDDLLWLHGDAALPGPSAADPADGGAGAGGRPRRAELLGRLDRAQGALQGALLRLRECEGRFSHLENECARIAGGVGERAASFAAQVGQRRMQVMPVLERAAEVLALAQGVLVFEACREGGEMAAQMDAGGLDAVRRLGEAAARLAECRAEGARAAARRAEVARELPALRRAREQAVRAEVERAAEAADAAEGLGRALAELEASAAAVREVVAREELLAGETAALLDAVARGTEGGGGGDAAQELHAGATGLRRDQRALKALAAELSALLPTAAPAAPAPAAVDVARMRGLGRLAREFAAAVGRCRERLQALARRATAHAQALGRQGGGGDDEGEGAFGEAPPAAAEASQDDGASAGAGGDSGDADAAAAEPGADSAAAATASANGGVNAAAAAAAAAGGKGLEQRNAYAVSVLKRVRQKMDGRADPRGRDGDGGGGGGFGGGKLSVQEQVEAAIREATSVDRLCQMYEGWTPWA